MILGGRTLDLAGKAPYLFVSAPVLLGTCLLITVLAVPSNNYAQSINHGMASGKAVAANSALNHDLDLEARIGALDAAKRAGDLAAVRSAAQRVVGLALRRSGEIKLRQQSPAKAVDLLRRSLDFEEASVTRRDLAIAYLAGNQTDEALSAVTELLTADPQDPQGSYIQGRVWMAMRLYERAIDSFTHSLNAQSNQNVSYWLGAALLETRQPERARSIFQQIVDNTKNQAEWHVRFSDAYRNAGYAEKATHEIQIAIQLGAKNAKTPRTNAPELAADLIDEFPTESGPGRSSSRENLRGQDAKLREITANALNDLGTAEARQQQFSLALAHFHEAEAWKADTPGLNRNMGIAAMRIGDYPEAVRALRLVVQENPKDSVARMSLGSALFASNAFTDTVQTLRPLGTSVIEHPEVAYTLASSLIKTNNYPEATKLLTEMEGTALTPQMLLLVAQAWSQMAVYPRTVEACHRALQADSQLQNAHYLAGLALIRQDRPAEATQEFRDELALDPENVEAQYNLAFVLLQQSQDAEAMRWLRSVLARNPDHSEANYELGKQLFSSGDATDAIPYLEAAARLKPEFQPVHYQLQAAYRATGRKDEADREAKIYKDLKAKSRNITLPPPREQSKASTAPN